MRDKRMIGGIWIVEVNGVPVRMRQDPPEPKPLAGVCSVRDVLYVPAMEDKEESNWRCAYEARLYFQKLEIECDACIREREKGQDGENHTCMVGLELSQVVA